MKTARVYRSLTRPVLLIGLAREVAILYIGLFAIFALAYRPSATTGVLIATLLAVYPVLRRAYARDPQSLAVLKVHIQRSGLYLARRPHGHDRRG